MISRKVMLFSFFFLGTLNSHSGLIQHDSSLEEAQVLQSLQSRKINYSGEICGVEWDFENDLNAEQFAKLIESTTDQIVVYPDGTIREFTLELEDLPENLSSIVIHGLSEVGYQGDPYAKAIKGKDWYFHFMKENLPLASLRIVSPHFWTSHEQPQPVIDDFVVIESNVEADIVREKVAKLNSMPLEKLHDLYAQQKHKEFQEERQKFMKRLKGTSF